MLSTNLLFMKSATCIQAARVVHTSITQFFNLYKKNFHREENPSHIHIFHIEKFNFVKTFFLSMAKKASFSNITRSSLKSILANLPDFKFAACKRQSALNCHNKWEQQTAKKISTVSNSKAKIEIFFLQKY